MALSNVLSFPNRGATRLRVKAQTCIVTGMLVPRITEIASRHRAACTRRLAELLDIYAPHIIIVDGVAEHLTILSELPHSKRLDHIADRIAANIDIAQATTLPSVPMYGDDEREVKDFTSFAVALLNYSLFLQTLCVLNRRIAS